MSNFAKTISEVFKDTFEETLNNHSVAELNIGISDFLFTVNEKTQDHQQPDYVYVTLYSDLFDEPLTTYVKRIKLLNDNKKLRTEDLNSTIDKSFRRQRALFNILCEHSKTICWETAKKALEVNCEITRASWQNNKIFMTVYKHSLDTNIYSPELRVYYQDKKDFSTGWSPSIEDKEANDWIIKKKT